MRLSKYLMFDSYERLESSPYTFADFGFQPPHPHLSECRSRVIRKKRKKFALEDETILARVRAKSNSSGRAQGLFAENDVRLVATRK